TAYPAARPPGYESVTIRPTVTNRTELAPRTLADAVRAVSEVAGQDPSVVLEELRRQAEPLLGCDAAGIHRAEATVDGLIFRRVTVSWFAAARGAVGSPPWRPGPNLLVPLVQGRVVFYDDFQAAIDLGDVQDQPWLRAFKSALYAPLITADGLFGLLFA